MAIIVFLQSNCFCKNGEKPWSYRLPFDHDYGCCCWYTWDSSWNSSKQGKKIEWWFKNLELINWFQSCIYGLSLTITIWFFLLYFETPKQVKHLRKWIFDCRDPSSQAFKLGLAASIIMILAHFIANLLGGCICIRSSNDFKTATPNKQLAVASLIFSWYIH